jgi:adenylate cyclase
VLHLAMAGSWNVEDVRAKLRLTSGLVMLAFVVSHLVAHVALLISIDWASTALRILMAPWRTVTGTVTLTAAFLIHYLNGLWSIYIRRSLRMPRWELWQMVLGLCIPILLTMHVVGTRVAELTMDFNPSYGSTLLTLWYIRPWTGILQTVALVVVWIHACIGIHFWLRTKSWYANWQIGFVSFGILVPTLALAGFVAAGNETMRAVTANPDYLNVIVENANSTAASTKAGYQIMTIALSLHLGLVAVVFGARGTRAWFYHRQQLPILTHANGRKLAILPGATALETLRDHGIPHASVCGGRARCTTCRVLVTQGVDGLPKPEAQELAALKRVGATPETRLACQIRPTSDIAILPLFAADARAVDGTVRGGLEGSERLITVVFVDLRGSTTISEGKLPYDVLYLLNQFFHEMTKALIATRGHYSQFTGDGLMALYGLDETDPRKGAADAMRGAFEMLAGLERLNNQLKSEMSQPLQIGIGIHHSEAIVGTMGPPKSQIITAIGDTVNTCARLESLTKDYNCPIIVSRQAAEAAGLNVGGRRLFEEPVKGRKGKVEFYALEAVSDLPI